jgi:hypothetical protein
VAFTDLRPEEFIAGFFGSFTELIRSSADDAEVVDRYYTPDIVQIVDGNRLDRIALIAHLRPVRKNLVSYRFDVHEAVVSGDRIAARFTIHAQLRKAGPVATEVGLFAQFTSDGRMRYAHQLTRTVRSADS